MKVFTAYVDGACRRNPGPGGWGVLLLNSLGKPKRLCGGIPESTTNNRMELLAAIMALEALDEPSAVKLFSDSQYVVRGITEWLPGWKRKGWRSSDGAVKNRDLWERLEAATTPHAVQWQWIKGHAGDQGNEEADRLANQGLDDCVAAHGRDLIAAAT